MWESIEYFYIQWIFWCYQVHLTWGCVFCLYKELLFIFQTAVNKALEKRLHPPRQDRERSQQDRERSQRQLVNCSSTRTWSYCCWCPCGQIAELINSRMFSVSATHPPCGSSHLSVTVHGQISISYTVISLLLILHLAIYSYSCYLCCVCS